MMLSATALGELVEERFTAAAFRLETLPAYEVASDRKRSGDGAELSDFDRYLAGEAEPTWERKRPWLETLAREREHLRYRYRVRILGGPTGLSDYERYSCEWGYALNTRAGEGVFVLDRGEKAVPEVVVDHDFWLLDDEVPVRMHYAEDGRFVGATEEPGMLRQYRAARDAALGAAEPFALWWARHPQVRRVTPHSVA